MLVLVILELHPRYSTHCSSCHLTLSRRFSHPVAVLPRAALSINHSDAVILSINSTGPRGDLCSDFSIRITVTLHLGSSATACVQLHVQLPSRKGAVSCIRIDMTVLHVSWQSLLPCQNFSKLPGAFLAVADKGDGGVP